MENTVKKIIDCGDRVKKITNSAEIAFYKENRHKSYVPKVFECGDDYVILEKLQMSTLYGVWHTFSEPKREEIVAQICEILRDLHKRSGDLVFIHGDLHFGNILCDGTNIKLIDFEDSGFFPVEKELKTPSFMCEMPHLLADAENEKFVKAEDYKNIMSYFKKYYPEMFDVPNLEKRLAVYHLQDSLEQFLIYKNEKWLRDRILRLANEIISPD